MSLTDVDRLAVALLSLLQANNAKVRELSASDN